MEENKEILGLNTNIQKPKTDKLNYGFKVLSNGIKVLLISDPDTKKCAAALGVNIGSLVDKKDEQGLAHFCEHLLTMGNKKYPAENEYGEYLTKNGGFSNAHTLPDKTIYYFNVSNEGFEGALDRFAQYFISPNFNEGSVERELKAVDNEFSNNLNNDSRRMTQIKISEINKDSPFNHFGTGNIKTLSLPNIRDRLLEYYKKYYTSEIMNLCVYSNKSLEEQLKLVESLFSLVPKIDNFVMPRYDEIKPYDDNNLKYLYKVVPVKDINEIQLEWYLPFCDDYHTRPTSYLAAAIGHEGPYTLTSSLNKDNLCNELVAGPANYCKTYSSFYVSISLTKKGIENYKEVILRTLKYIKVIQNKGINERYYDELKQIVQMQFDYKSKSTPLTMVENCVSNLMEYAPEDVITSTHLFGEFKEPLLKKYLDLLTLDNLNIYFVSKLFEKECNLTENYYGTKYYKEKLNITEDEINSYNCKDIFDYPPENNFIPKNFDILPPPEKISKYPEKIIDHKNMEVWYLQDAIFKMPKAYSVTQFITPEDLCDFSEIKLRIITVIFDKIIEVELGEFLYMAEEANVNITLSTGVNKTNLIFSGFSESLKRGIKEIYTKIQNLDINTERCKETLELEQKDILRRAKNVFLNSSYQVNLQYLKGLLYESYKNPVDIINFYNDGKNITIEDLILYKNSLFKNSKIKWLIQGNVSKEEVLEIVEETNKILEIDINKEKTGKFHKARPVVISKNYNYIYRVKSPNPGEKSSSLISLYQTDLLNDKEFQYIKILETFLKDKFYDQLRTKETLGYVVSLLTTESSGYFAFANIVQSNSKTPEFCAGRVRNFYKENYEKAKNISEEEFKLLVNSQLIIVTKKDDNLSNVFLRNWNEINRDTYKFDYRERAKEYLEQCNKEEFIKIYEKYFINEVAIVDSEFVCDEHYEQNEKDLQENKNLQNENIKKRIVCDTLEDFTSCNILGVVYNNPLFMANNN